MSDIPVYLGFDSREPTASEVAAHSIRRRTRSPINIKYLKHKDLRKEGAFTRTWMTNETGNMIDVVDGKPFSTEYSHTRFLIPHLQNYKGWALFLDPDMLFLCDIEKLFALKDDKYAVMCVKHNHTIGKGGVKMDGCEQQNYYRKNWSSFVLWNCNHPANRQVTKEFVNKAKGSELHSFSWLSDDLIGLLPHTYNYIRGVSPALPAESKGKPDVVHYTEGGPWFDNCKHVAYAQFWLDEYENYQANREDYIVSHIPTIAYDREDA